MSFSTNVPIPHLGQGQLVSVWVKDFLTATTMLNMNDGQRIQLLPMYMSRTPGEKALAESVSEHTVFKDAIDEIKKLIDGEPSEIQLMKEFYDIQAPQGGDCTSVYFELYSKGTAAGVPTNMMFMRFLTFFKAGDKFYSDHKSEIKADLTKAQLLKLFGEFKTVVDKQKLPTAIKVEKEEMYHAVAEEDMPSWARDLQDQLSNIRHEIRENRGNEEESVESSEAEESEAYYYNEKSKKKQFFDQSQSKGDRHQNKGDRSTKKCKICKKTGHSPENCYKRICSKCDGKGHSDFECPSYKKKSSSDKGKPTRQA